MKKVTLYTTPTCGFCSLAKDFLNEKGIEFESVDISVNSEAAQKIIEKTGQLGVPVAVIKDSVNEREEVIIGFNLVEYSNFFNEF